MAIAGCSLEISEQVVHVGVLRSLRDLLLHSADGLSRLLLKHESGRQQTKSAGGVGIEFKRLFEQSLGFGNLLLDQAKLREFQIACGIFRIELDGLMEVRVRFVVGFLAAFGNAAPDVSGRRTAD